MSETMTYEDIVAECKRLRGAWEQARSEFYLYLIRVEQEMHSLWSAAGCATFGQFLRSNNLCEHDEYLKFVRGLGHIGGKSPAREAVELGPCVTMAAGVLADAAPDGISKLKERARAFAKVHHMPPSKKMVGEWKNQIVRESRPNAIPSIVRRASELERLREENKRLRAENAALKARLAELEGTAA